MAELITTVAILTPKPGRQGKLVEVLEEMTQKVQAAEPGCVSYQLHKEVGDVDGSGDVVMIEKYANQEAFESHSKTPHMAQLIHAFGEEFVLAGAPVIKNIALKSGFTS